MKTEIQFIPPKLPSIGKVKITGKAVRFDVGTLSKEGAEEYAEMLKGEFMKHWESRRKAKGKEI